MKCRSFDVHIFKHAYRTYRSRELPVLNMYAGHIEALT